MRWVALLALLALGAWAWAEEALPKDYLEKADSMPNLATATEGTLGQSPMRAAVACYANALLWLNDHGCPGLAPSDGDPASPGQLMNALYESIGGDQHSKVGEVLDGLASYCRSRGYEVSAGYEGWLKGGDKYRVAPRPDLQWILDGVRGNSNVVLQLGLYRYDADQDLYTYKHTKYLTLVGYHGANDAHPRLITHDPVHPGVQQIRAVTALQSGTFAAFGDIPADTAAGWLTVEPAGDGVKNSVIVIDAAFRFRVQKSGEGTAETTD